MDIQKFVDNVFNYTFLSPDVKRNIHTPLEDRIFEILTPSYFRIGPMTEEIRQLLKNKIKYSVKKGLPIKLVLAVGGFKNFRVDSSPHIDWAEVFQLSFILNTLWEISDVYGPGLHIEYSGDSEAMGFISNIKLSGIKVYNEEFEKLLEFVQLKLPGNIRVTSNNFDQFYTYEEIKSEVEKRIAATNMNDIKIKSYIEKSLRHAENNFWFDGQDDLTTASNKNELLKNSTLAHKYWLEIDYERRRDYLEGGHHIPIIHKAFPGCYPICSVRGEDKQFWVCKGALRIKKDKFIPSLYSAKMLREQSNEIENLPVNFSIKEVDTLRAIPVVHM